jgi:anthranilate synthase/aminodeoxychorismate synthase-like glutamine amidotransferase
MIDNYDSFTYNLVQYIGEMGREIRVLRNDELPLEEAVELEPSHIVVSPGPGNPDEAGISVGIIRHFAGKVPILGVCLGHQCIGRAFGGTVDRAERLMHGKTSQVYHHGSGLFQGIPNPFTATRYHSLIVREESLPETLKVTAYTSEGEVMGLRAKDAPVSGVQFHPESILTEHGRLLIANFLNGR